MINKIECIKDYEKDFKAGEKYSVYCKESEGCLELVYDMPYNPEHVRYILANLNTSGEICNDGYNEWFKIHFKVIY